LDKLLLVYNPKSGNRNVPKKLDYIIQQFMENDIIVVPYRTSFDNRENLNKLIVSGDYSSVVVSGGDGTVAGVVNTMINNGIDIPLGIIPAGTCNDFARSLGLPSDMKKCIDVILNGYFDEVDAGLINDQLYFLNTCAGGNFVDASFNTSTELKKNIGPLAYYMKALGEVTQIKPMNLKITTDDEVIQDDFILFLIQNGRHAAGFSNLNKSADLCDGYMDILLVNNCPAIELPGLLLKVLGNDFINDRNVTWLRTRKCSIEGDTDSALSLDGEKWGSLPIKVEFLNRILKVFVPE
jgi:YegS/Rv2252/BmrU family lipid kinase